MPKKSEISRDKIKNILVIRPDAIGDLVLTLPAIQALKEHFPGAKITALIREYTRSIANSSSAIDAVIYDYDLKKYRFDLSVNFFNEFKDTFAAFSAGIPLRLGDSSRVLTAWMNNLRVFRNWNSSLHEIEQNMALLHPLGITMPTGKPHLIPDPLALARIDKLDLDKSGRLVGLHCGSSTNQPWPPENFGVVANYLVDKKYQVLLVGGEKEKSPASIIKLMCPAANDLTGTLPLADLIALISRLDYYIGLNTGPTHIAAAFNVPTVMINPNLKSPISRWRPWQTRHLIVSADRKEREIKPESVIGALANWLSAAA